MRIRMSRRRSFALLDDHLDGGAGGGPIGDGDELTLKVYVAGVRLRLRRSDEQFVLGNRLKAGPDLVIELPDRLEVDLVGFATFAGRVLRGSDRGTALSGSACGVGRGVRASRNTFQGEHLRANRRVDRLLLGPENAGFGHLVADEPLDDFLRERLERQPQAEGNSDDGIGKLARLKCGAPPMAVSMLDT